MILDKLAFFICKKSQINVWNCETESYQFVNNYILVTFMLIIFFFVLLGLFSLFLFLKMSIYDHLCSLNQKKN